MYIDIYFTRTSLSRGQITRLTHPQCVQACAGVGDEICSLLYATPLAPKVLVLYIPTAPFHPIERERLIYLLATHESENPTTRDTRILVIIAR